MAINLDLTLDAWSQAGINPHGDFHTLPSSKVEVILDQARLCGYRKPKNANGSKGRYFFYAVQRKLNAELVADGKAIDKFLKY